MFYLFYILTLFLLSPFIFLYLLLRLLKGKEDWRRFSERLGFSHQVRPEGRVVWLHGASLGEGLSVLPLIENLLKKDPDLFFVLTTGTVSSAQVLKGKLPPRTIHQYVPLDIPFCVSSFLKHWRPRLAIRVDSELWPVAISKIHAARIPHLLVNAKMTEKSFKRYRKFSFLTRFIFSKLTRIYAKSGIEFSYFKALGVDAIEQMDNLKFATPLMPPSQAEVKKFQSLFLNRPTWLAASTGVGKNGDAEEPFVIAAHQILKEKISTVLTILNLRHPTRLAEVCRLLDTANFSYAIRSKGQNPDAKTDFYICDTFGEMNLFYAACPISFSGRSLVNWGGNTPTEPIAMKTALIVGPFTQNFDEIYTELEQKRAFVRVSDSKTLSAAVFAWLTRPEKRNQFVKIASDFLNEKSHVAENLANSIVETYLKPTAWLLTDNRTGTKNQLFGLASHLTNWKIIEQPLAYKKWIFLPNFLHFCPPIFQRKKLLETESVPDLILSAGRRTASTALWLKSHFSFATTAHLLATDLPVAWFDFVFRPLHDGGAFKPPVYPYVGALHRFTRARLLANKQAWESQFTGFSGRPIVAILVGGATKNRPFSVQQAEKLARDLKAFKEKNKVFLWMTTSRRTGEKQTKILAEKSGVDYFYSPNMPSPNPYPAFLALADSFVITGESVSMLSEATAAEKPIFIYAPDSFLSSKHRRFVQSLYDCGVAKSFEVKSKLFKPPAFPNETERLAKILSDFVRGKKN